MRRFNDRHERTGTLWEGRFKASLVDSERYVLACYRYIEMNPVRAGLVRNPREYSWSSVHANAYGEFDSLIELHPALEMLGTSRPQVIARYRAFLHEPSMREEVDTIRKHVNQGKALGPVEFQRRVGELLGRSVTLKPMGRPGRRVEC